EYLNTKANSSYKHTTAATQKCIKAHWNEGFRLDDFKRVVDNKVEDWINDEKFSKFLRPQTLFSNKFEGYLNEKPAKQSNKQVANNQYSNKNIVINKPLGIREQEQYLDEDELRIRRIIQEESSND
ncbi:conserved phage C-terminal domain-containing protein, partial [Arthrospira platensis SPKY2]